ETYADIPGGKYAAITALVKGGGTKDLWLRGDVEVSELILNAATRIHSLYLQDYRLSGTSGNDMFDLTGIKKIWNWSPHVINLGGGDDTLRAGAVALWAHGGSGNDTLYGGTGSDRLFGGDGDDIIRGGGGFDEVHGGDGADLFVAAQTTPKEFGGGEEVTIKDFDPGIDRIDVSGYGISTFSQLQLIMVESLGSAYFSATLRSKIYSFQLNGVSKEALGAGDFIFDTSSDREISGTGFGDRLFASRDGSIVDGRHGVNELVGGDGADTFVASGQDTIIGFNTNVDRIDLENYGISSFKQLQMILDVNVYGDAYFERRFGGDLYKVTLKGIAINALTAKEFIFYSGRAANIVGTSSFDALFASAYGSKIRGGLGNDTLFGGDGEDKLYGGADWDVLYGGDGNDLLSGDSGIDKAYGGRGDDTYVVTHRSDSTLEEAGEGTDLVVSSYTGTTKLFDNVENLTLLGSSDSNATGNGLSNIITGNSGNNVLKGGEGDDTLDGRSGTDRMEGGVGDDIYVVSEKEDAVIENNGAGTDLVKSSISYRLTDNVEKLALTGSLNTNGIGNDLANTIIGNSGNNIIMGNQGNDILIGGSGNDTLDGGSGVDRMGGGGGDDIYVVDDRKDRVLESTGAGTDLVKASVSYTLATNVENLSLMGVSDINGVGNALANVITGSAGKNLLKGMAGDDRLVGGRGADDLYGGTGKDTFVFMTLRDSTVSESGRDTVFDFSQKEGDRIDLSGFDAKVSSAKNDAFVFLGTKDFSKKAGELRFEKKATDTYIYGDVDGNGKADFAIHLDAAVTLVEGDFIL
ncbi:MAG: calcium-binding protein, partial [Shinella sp.]